MWLKIHSQEESRMVYKEVPEMTKKTDGTD